MATWPADPFPQVPERNGYTDNEVDTVIRSPMGYGPAKIRPRVQVPIDNTMQTFTLTGAQKTEFETFYKANLALRFDWDNTIDGSGVYRFLAPPMYQEVTCDVWKMQCKLERLP